MFKVFNRCLTARTSGHDQTKINILQMFHVVINCINFDYAALLWWDFMNNVKQKKFLKIADLMKKFPNIPKRIKEDYHSIKDDISLFSVSTTRDVRVRGMLILNAFLTEEIYATDGFKEYETVFMKGKKRKQNAGESSSPHKLLKMTIRQQKVVEGNKDDDDFENREDEVHSHHNDHQEDDAPSKGEKRVKRHNASKSSNSERGSLSNHSAKDFTTYVSKQQQQKQQEWDAWVEETVIDEDEYGNTGKKKYILSLHKIHTEHFPEVDLEEKMNRCVRKEFNTFNEDAQITEVVRKTTDQPHGLGFMEQIIVMRENDKLDSFSKADFKYLNKNDIEDLYYLYRNKLGIKSYQIKVNLTAPTLTFPGIEAHELYFIVDKPSTGLICLNSKDEKRVMYLTEIVKFCDATLEKVLKEVKLKIFQSEPWRKPPLLGELDCDILRAIERQITKRLSHI
ncbi:hypothetical protein Tco_0979137 [Tanacetum coccineum]